MAKVSYPTTTNFGASTADSTGKLASGLAELQRIKAAMDAVVYPGPDFSRLESNTDFLVGTGDGENFYTGVQGLILALSTSDATGALGKLDKGI